MCGIVGAFSKTSPVIPATLAQATMQLRHRGPDHQQYWLASNGRVGLGHARLSVIDLETGDQPILSQDQTLCLVVNGEFYDFERIRADLERRGHCFQTRSDSEIVLHLYEEYGVHCLQHLRGEFAFLLWDERQQQLFWARDRFGIKPLYYARRGDTLYVASEVKALFAAGVPAQWDHEAYYLNSYLPFQDRTLFDGVYQLPAGHYALTTHRQTRLYGYWDFNYPLEQDRSPCSDQEYIAQFRHQLDEAVRLRLRADVPVGCYLSGGIDSSAILGLALPHISQGMSAFTIVFDDAGLDESHYAREMAEYNDVDLHCVPATEVALAEAFSDAVWHAETTFSNTHGVAKFLLSRYVRDAGYKVVLVGEGADEILAGYPPFKVDFEATSTTPETARRDAVERLQHTKPDLGKLLVSNPDATVPILDRVLGFSPSWISTFCLGAKKSFPYFYDDAFLARFKDCDPIRRFLDSLDIQNQVLGREPVDQSAYLWSKSILPNYLLKALGDGMEMAHAIEGRVPFLDHHVVELAVNMPVAMKLRGGQEKYILREAARDLLPATIYRRHKQSFMLPSVLNKRNGPLYTLLNDTFRSSSAQSFPFADERKLIGFLDRALPHIRDRTLLGYIDLALMPILSACLMQQRFGL